jgi:hypothetical protein
MSTTALLVNRFLGPVRRGHAQELDPDGDAAGRHHVPGGPRDQLLPVTPPGRAYWYETNTGVGSTAMVSAGERVGVSSS